jgi:hypothetical protein
MHFGFIDVILLHSGITNMFRICKVIRTRIHFNKISILVLYILKMAT